MMLCGIKLAVILVHLLERIKMFFKAIKQPKPAIKFQIWHDVSDKIISQIWGRINNNVVNAVSDDIESDIYEMILVNPANRSWERLRTELKSEYNTDYI